MNLGKKSYSSRWGHERTRYVTNPAKRIRREKALGRLESQLKLLDDTIANCKNAFEKETLIEGTKARRNRINQEILTLKSRI